MDADASVAQLDRVFGSDPKGRRFEPCRGRHEKENVLTDIFCFAYTAVYSQPVMKDSARVMNPQASMT